MISGIGSVRKIIQGGLWGGGGGRGEGYKAEILNLGGCQCLMYYVDLLKEKNNVEIICVINKISRNILKETSNAERN